MVVPPISPHHVTKDALRQRLRQQRRDYVRSLTDSTRTAMHRRLADMVCAHLPAGLTVGSYVAIGSEIDPQVTDASARALGLDLAYPWFADRKADMQFRCGTRMVPGPFNFAQPDPDAPLVQPSILLVPLVGIDLNGNRLGQGAGHYDRYIASRQAGKFIYLIGLCYKPQIIDEILADPWDVPMHAIATPERWIAMAG